MPCKEHAPLKDMLPFCRSSTTAISFVKAFRDELKKHMANVQKIFFVPCYLYGYGDGEKSYFVGEQFLEGALTLRESVLESQCFTKQIASHTVALVKLPACTGVVLPSLLKAPPTSEE